MSITVKDPEVEQFLYGKDQQEAIINIEYDYTTNYIYLIIQDRETQKLRMTRKQLRPFLWSKDLKTHNFYDGNKALVRRKMIEYGITAEPLNTEGDPRNEDGYKYLVTSTGTYNNLLEFFHKGGLKVFDHRELFQYCSPVEQYLMQTGKRLFKGFKEYNDIHRYIFDIETTGLDPNTNRCFMIGAKTTRGFEKLYAIEKDDDDAAELKMITEWATDLNNLKPSIICGYNSENFDFFFIIERLKILGGDIKNIVQTLNPKYPFKRKDATIKLANEVENYQQTVIWGINVIDIIHSVRRAMAINSEIKSAGLKYVCKFSEIARPNRVYIPDGSEIWKIYKENDEYWFNETNGQYRKCSDNPDLIDLDVKHPDTYKKVNGQYIVRRYLMDDL
jgi:DNA polymerase elongation subunit (family B)